MAASTNPTSPSPTIRKLLDTMPQVGRVAWIGERPAKRAEVRSADATHAAVGLGLTGDYRAKGREPDPSSSRQVTLIQGEHLDAVAAMLELPDIEPGWTRRNVVVRGINLLALKNRRFAVGDAVFEGTGGCSPCSRMEENLGPGGYNAMRGHGGITARVVVAGDVRVGDPVRMIGDAEG